MLERWKRQRRVQGVVRKMVAARRAGHGLYLAEWQVPASAMITGALDPAVEPIIEWCRRIIAGCRRPHGIDHFDLVLACAVQGGGRPRSAEFRDLRPPALYAEEGLGAQVSAFLQRLTQREAAAMPPSIRIAAALFSWGDAAHAALPPRS